MHHKLMCGFYRTVARLEVMSALFIVHRSLFSAVHVSSTLSDGEKYIERSCLASRGPFSLCMIGLITNTNLQVCNLSPLHPVTDTCER